MQSWPANVTVEAVRLVGAMLLLLLTWSLGQRLLGKADLRKKRREIDLSLSLEFELRFGEFKATWRQWRAHYWAAYRNKPPGQVDATDPVRWKLFENATAAEGRLEAIFVKLATERVLSDQDIRRIGLFRQAYQELREAIRDCVHMPYKSEHPRYTFFNVYGCHVAHIIVRDHGDDEPTAADAERTLLAVQAIRKPEWRNEVKAFAAERGLDFSAVSDGDDQPEANQRG